MQYTITIDKSLDGTLIREYLKDILKLSRINIIALKTDADGIKVDGQHATVRHILKAGETLQLTMPEKQGTVLPDNTPIELVYCDKWLYVVYKPHALATHPDKMHYTNTLGNRIVGHFGNQAPLHIVTRLDKDTQGLVLGALDRVTKRLLVEQLQQHQINKTYIALCDGVPQQTEGDIDAPLTHTNSDQKTHIDSQGKYAYTHYKLLKSTATQSLIELQPTTGRTHQLRVHLASINCPIVGDTVYNANANPDIPLRLLMHKLQFTHPHTGQTLTVTYPLPQWAKEVE